MSSVDGELELEKDSNPYLDYYKAFVKEHGDLYSVFDPSVDEETRLEQYNALDVGVAMKYSWAIPDERALQIIKHFGPIVEMGAGSGYWAKLLELRGVDVVCYDLHVADEAQNQEKEETQEGSNSPVDDATSTVGKESEGHSKADQENDVVSDEGSEEEVEVEQVFWTDVKQGTPQKLSKHSDRTLFLCYPDDFEDSEESMALDSLMNYTGDTVIHVGELFGQTICKPGVWGRTSSGDFQTHLASVYHKILQVPLPSWHSSVDTLTVWKRTKTTIMESEMYAYIPPEERLDLVAASPSTRHLVDIGSETAALSSKGKRKMEKGKPALSDAKKQKSNS